MDDYVVLRSRNQSCRRESRSQHLKNTKNMKQNNQKLSWLDRVLELAVSQPLMKLKLNRSKHATKNNTLTKKNDVPR